MKKPIRCIYKGKIYDSLYEAKKYGIRNALPIDKNVYVGYNDTEEMLDIFNYIIDTYEELIFSIDVTNKCITWRDPFGLCGGSLFFYLHQVTVSDDVRVVVCRIRNVNNMFLDTLKKKIGIEE